MEWLTTLWNKLNKPLHFLFVGLAIILFVPSELLWTGYITIAFGLAGACEWWYEKFYCQWLAEYKTKKELKKFITILNKDEKAVLNKQLKKGEQTFYLNWNDYNSFPKDNDTEYRKLVGIYEGLRHKKFLTGSSNHTIATFHITNEAWDILKRELKS
jgi:hypothetical protein